METPLDVLSRAASMVQTNDANREAALRQAMDQRESPPKELPTKMLKCKRMWERQQMSETLGFDDQHSDKSNSRKCAGTQTPFSSLGGEGYPLPSDGYQRPGESYHILDLDARNRVESCPRPMMGIHGQPNSPRSHSSPSHDDANSVPLNLTTSSMQSQSIMPSPNHGQQRPSVITCASTAAPQPANPRFIVVKNSGELQNHYGPPSEQSDPCDPAIEEHFRRSLGQNYPDYMGATSRLSKSPSPARTSPPLPANQTWTHPLSGSTANNTAAVSVTGSVDDHFAKSLGDTWTQIKAKKDPVQLDIFTGSVDDHFAKALGDTWLRIKAEKEGSSSNSNSAPSSPPSAQSAHHSQPSLVPT